ncbi:MAG: hypothetical protein JW818_14180 [Pirellulales bacterium]|nr:hypothetical protein [Pirellulales bacterium]
MTPDESQHVLGGSRPGTDLYRLKVSRYDRVSGMLLALVTLIGLIVSIMLILWLSGQFGENLTAVPVEFLPPGDQEEDAAGPDNDDIEPPPPEEEIEVETDDLLEAVVDANATRYASLRSRVSGDGHGKGGGGTGRGRKGGPALIVRFPKGSTIQQYAQQLDFFGIELAVRQGNTVYYAKNLSRARPTTSTGTVAEENAKKRLNLLASGRDELEASDRVLLKKAGITHPGRVFKFLDPRWAGRLYQLLKNVAGDRKVRSIRYLVVPDGSGGYNFEVLGQPTFR